MVATDGSEHAEHALNIASSLVHSKKSKLIVVHVIGNDEPTPGVRKDVEVEFGSDLRQRLSSTLEIYRNLQEIPNSSEIVSHHREVSRVINTIYGEQLLKRSEDQLRENGHESVTTLLLNGDPADQLVAQAKKYEADMVVLGCRGLGRVKMLFGSVSQQVVHELDCRVVLVK
jgi:nucleotide-binding universal stress UspA family protein